MDDTDDPLIKSMTDEEFKNLQCEEKEKEERKLELKRLEAKEKASVLWKKMKAIEEQKAAEEKLKQQKLRQEEEARWKCEEEKQIAARQHEMRLRQQLKEKYMKDKKKEKERLEMQKIKEKYRSKLLCKVRKDMGLPTFPVPKMLPSAGPNPTTSYMETSGNKPISSSHHNLPHSGLTPPGLLAKVKQEKYHRSELGDPDDQYNINGIPHGEKQHLASTGDSTPPAKQFTNKEDLTMMLTPKSKQCSARQTLFSPLGKVALAHAGISDNTLEIQSVGYMKSLSGVKYDLLMAGHIFLNEHVPKDYVSKVWKTIVDNNILVEKKALAEQTSNSFFGILTKQFPEFSSEESHSVIGKIRRMLCRFACVNCMNFAEVRNQELSVVSHVMFPFSLQLKSKQ